VDILDMSARVLGLIDLYKDRIVRELAIVLTGETRTMLDGGTLLRVACVAGGAAVALSEGERAYVTWCTYVHGSVIYLCTCGGHGGAESIEVRSFVGTSSTCSHARALKASFHQLVHAVGVSDDSGLIEMYPVLNNAAAEPSTECAVYLATKTATKMAVFAVLDQGAWAAVTVRRRLGKKSKSNKRTQLRAACTQVSCAKHHWWCPHASAASRWSTELRLAATLADGMGGSSLPDGLNDVRLPSSAPSRAPLTPSQQGAADAAFSDETRWRNSRNLLPCKGEVDDCLLFDKLAAAGRAGGTPSFLPDVLCEAHCFSCGAEYNGMGVKNTGAVLHTLRGRVSLSLRQWVCSCGKEVPYDGAHETLFASTSKTVFTRTFMDVMSQMVFTGHSTLSSAASVLCFLLEATDSLSGAPSGLARQTLIAAAHRYARTLIVPADLFRCGKCKVVGDRPYIAIVADGEVLSILRNQSQPLVRVTDDVRVVPMDTNHGSCVPVAAIRGAVRKRLSADRGAVVRLTKEEHAALSRLAEELLSVPVAHGVEEQHSAPRAVMWAAAFLFFSFYTNEQAHELPVVAGAAAGADDNAEAAGTDQGANGVPAVGAQAGVVNPGGGDAPMANAAAGGVADGVQGGAAAVAGGGAAGAAAADGPTVCFSREVTDAFGGMADKGRLADQWRVVRRFLTTFVAEPVLGAFAGLRQRSIQRLAKQLVLGKPVSEWRPNAKAVESVGVVWPFLRLIGEADDVDPLTTRAIGELLLFTCGVDAYWETLWWRQASDGAKAFEAQWRVTSPDKYKAWLASRPDVVPANPLLASSVHSRARAVAQAMEVRSGHVWPDLEPVRPFITDGKADAVNAVRAAKASADRETLQALLSKELGADDCRHSFLNSDTFMPGIENFLCPCGLLIGYDFLDRAESPAHVLASIAQRFTLLPSVIYFDTACQLARNASRRVPWLVNRSDTACSVDRAHHQKKQHKCSPVFDADAYPSRSVRHRTACAESRHSLNKAFKTHLVHLRQDHFIVQMRLLGSMINLRVKMRKSLGKETNHRRMCAFFHEHVQSYCDRRSCTCLHGRRQDADAAVAVVPDGAANDAAETNNDDGDAAANGAAAGVGVGAGGVAPADTHNDAAVGQAGAPAVGHGALNAVQDIVADAVLGAAAPVVEEAVLAAIAPVGYSVGLAVGQAVGQAAVERAFTAAGEAAVHVGAVGARRAVETAAGSSAACADVQRPVHAAVQAAVDASLQDAARSAGHAAAVAACQQAGIAAGLAAAVALARNAHPMAAGDGGAVAAGHVGGAAAHPGSGVSAGQAVVAAAGQGGGVAGAQGGVVNDAAPVVFGQASVQAALRAALQVHRDEADHGHHDKIGVGASVGGGGAVDGGDLADDEGHPVVESVAAGVCPDEEVDVDGGVGTDDGVTADGLGVVAGKDEAALSSSEDFSSSSEEEHATAAEEPRTGQE